MSNIEAFVENMKIKKAILGGFDKESVYQAMHEICSDYQTEINRLKAEREQFEKELQKTVQELEEANKNLQLLNYQLEEEKQSRKEFNDRLNSLDQAIDVINLSKEKIINEAKIAADGILTEANQKYKSIVNECFVQQQQMDIELTYMMTKKQKIYNNMKNLRVGLACLISDIKNLENNDIVQMDISNEKAGNADCQIAYREEYCRRIQTEMGYSNENGGN